MLLRAAQNVLDSSQLFRGATSRISSRQPFVSENRLRTPDFCINLTART